jgi:hypothetical protein
MSYLKIRWEHHRAEKQKQVCKLIVVLTPPDEGLALDNLLSHVFSDFTKRNPRFNTHYSLSAPRRPSKRETFKNIAFADEHHKRVVALLNHVNGDRLGMVHSISCMYHPAEWDGIDFHVDREIVGDIIVLHHRKGGDYCVVLENGEMVRVEEGQEYMLMGPCRYIISHGVVAFFTSKFCVRVGYGPYQFKHQGKGEGAGTPATGGKKQTKGKKGDKGAGEREETADVDMAEKECRKEEEVENNSEREVVDEAAGAQGETTDGDAGKDQKVIIEVQEAGDLVEAKEKENQGAGGQIAAEAKLEEEESEKAERVAAAAFEAAERAQRSAEAANAEVVWAKEAAEAAQEAADAAEAEAAKVLATIAVGPKAEAVEHAAAKAEEATLEGEHAVERVAAQTDQEKEVLWVEAQQTADRAADAERDLVVADAAAETAERAAAAAEPEATAKTEAATEQTASAGATDAEVDTKWEDAERDLVVADTAAETAERAAAAAEPEAGQQQNEQQQGQKKQSPGPKAPEAFNTEDPQDRCALTKLKLKAIATCAGRNRCSEKS